MEFILIGDSWGRMFGYNEWIPTLFPKLSDYDLLRGIAMEIYGAVQALVDEQLKTYDPEHERHFLDQYHTRMLANADDPKNTFYRMYCIFYEIFLAREACFFYDFLLFSPYTSFWAHFHLKWTHFHSKWTHFYPK